VALNINLKNIDCSDSMLLDNLFVVLVKMMGMDPAFPST